MKKYYDFDCGMGGGYTPKPYFVKYLPVEGEIKKGDIVWVEDYKLRSKVIDVINRSQRDIVLETMPHNGTFDSGQVKKEKLFLCSRDIQVGDTVLLEAHPDFGYKKILSIEDRVVSTDDGNKTHDHNLIKAIGEISPNAVWVKEGDEFDEEQIQLCSQYGQNYNMDCLKIPSFLEQHEIYFRVQCSQCKTYH